MGQPAPYMTKTRRIFLALCGCLLLALFASSLTACDSGTPNQKSVKTINTKNDKPPVTYSGDGKDVVIRTLYGGGLKGSLSFAPEVSIYGDGTYILGSERKGKLSSDALEKLLDSLVNTYDLPDFGERQFVDIQDMNATYLQLALNNKSMEYAYGSYGHYQPKSSSLDEYGRLGKALTAINDAVNATSNNPYGASAYALLARRTFSANANDTYPLWPLSDFTLEQAATYECGKIPENENTPNLETPCLKFTIPEHAIRLKDEQYQSIKAILSSGQGIMGEGGLYYNVTLRPLLPDEISSGKLSMLGSQQSSYMAIPLREGGPE
ncbi:hypothetical protein [Ktedonospora formicarum]|uniref:Lipoprotein n=1 Tax=Ktedonospora formicarum TaxID=2778364 RepID=A0A8J3MW54_9CHLR|nr:hypothetical protein [Ktedonospora formicarum]GHO50005.1 hypothetical protein KSX_81680 [Ktedonospora formicarum]